MGDTSETEEFRELLERSSLGTPGARRLRARTPRAQAKLAAQIAEHQERLAAYRKAGDHKRAAQALTELANAYLVLGSNQPALDLARSATLETLDAMAELQAAAEKDADAIRDAAKTDAAALRASAEQERDDILRAAEHQASELRRRAQHDVEESEAQRIQAEAEFDFRLASRRQEAERQEAERHSAAAAAVHNLVTEAEQRAAKANAQADKTRSDAERGSRLLVANAKKNADLIIAQARAQADQLMTDVKDEIGRHVAETQRELTAERERITLHLDRLGQLLGIPLPHDRPTLPERSDVELQADALIVSGDHGAAADLLREEDKTYAAALRASAEASAAVEREDILHAAEDPASELLAVPLPDGPPTLPAAPGDELAVREDFQWLEQLLESVSPAQRAAILLVIVGASNQELAAMLGKDDVRPLLREGRDHLKTHLEYVEDRRSDSDGATILAEALDRLRQADREQADRELGGSEAYVRAGEQWLLADDPAAAVRGFYRALADGGPSSVDPRIPLARALFQLGRIEEAEEHIRALGSEPPRDPRMCDLLAELLVEQFDLPGALAWATAGVELCLGRTPGPVASGVSSPAGLAGAGQVAPADENELRLLLSLRFRIRNDLGLPEDDYDRLLDSPQLRPTAGSSQLPAGPPTGTQ
jgi:hypothetical protein